MERTRRRCLAAAVWAAWTIDGVWEAGHFTKARGFSTADEPEDLAFKRLTVPRRNTPQSSIGNTSVTAIRLSHEIRRSVERWALTQPDKPSRSEAIRRLIALALSEQSSGPKSRSAISKTSQMAERAIERIGDRSVPIEVRECRKQKLIKGPKEFREFRRGGRKSKHNT